MSKNPKQQLPQRILRSTSVALLTILAIAILGACGAVSAASRNTVNITPGAATVQLNGTQQFTASPGKVVWSVQGIQGGNATVGTISSSGLYTAPATMPTANPLTITAVSNTKTGSATVTLVNTVTTVGVTVSPSSASVQTGGSQQFSASVAGTTNTAVTWSVNGVAGGNSTVGTISTSGLYVAPSAVPSGGSVQVTATSAADSTKSSSAAVTITAPVTVSVSPTAAALQATYTQQFSDTVSGTTNTAVSWSVNGIAGGNSTVGTVSSAGLYTAPNVSSTTNETVTVTSAADPTKSASASVSVAPASTTVTVTISPTSATVQGGATQQFSAKVTGTTNTGITWQVGGITGGNSTVGTISSNGLYTAPMVSSNTPETITAVSSYDTQSSASAAVTVTPLTSAYYVATTGSDSNPGTAALPWRTITHAASVVKAGATVIVEDGVYSDSTLSGDTTPLVTIGSSGTAGNFITFRAEHKWGAILDGSNNTTGEGIKFSSGASYVRIQDFEVRNFSYTGIDAWSAGTNIEIRGNLIHNIGNICTTSGNGRVGIFLETSYLLVDSNVIHDIGRISSCSTNSTNNDHGIYVERTDHVTISNNVFFANVHGWDVHVYNGSGNPTTNLSVVANTFGEPNPSRPGHIVVAVPTSGLISDNIFYKATTAGIDFTGVSTQNGITVSNNLSTNLISVSGLTGALDPAISGVTYSNNIENTDPMLVSPTTHDYHLSSGSPAIDRGTSVGCPAFDMDGISRPQGIACDMGAYEYPQ